MCLSVVLVTTVVVLTFAKCGETGGVQELRIIQSTVTLFARQLLLSLRRFLHSSLTLACLGIPEA